MNAAEALQAARAAGIQVKIDGAELLLKASAPPPAAVLDGLSRHKAHILALLRPAKVDWTADDWLAFFDERAAIVEFDVGLSRAQANAQAFEYCVIEWLNRNPAQSVPGRCLGCGGGNRRGDPLLPFGTETSGHAWLHGTCWPAWHSERRDKAETGLRALGVRAPKHAELQTEHKAEISAAPTKPHSECHEIRPRRDS
jgi:hypothetical protein